MKKYISLILLMSLLLTSGIETIAIPKENEIKNAPEPRIQKIEKKLDELQELTMDKLKLKKELNEVKDIDKINNINNKLKSIAIKMAIIKEELYDLGAEEPSDELLLDLIKDSINKALEDSKTKKEMESIINSENWHPEEFVRDFKKKYDVWGYETKAYGEKVYCLMFRHNGNDPYLSKSSHKRTYGSFKEGSLDARNFVKEVVKIYAIKLRNNLLDRINLVKYLPYELVLDRQPDADTISGNNFLLTLDTASTIKFVYIKNDYEWREYCITNKIYYTYSREMTIFKDGKIHKYRDANDKGAWIYGDYDDAIYDAVKAKRNHSSARTSITKVSHWCEKANKGITIDQLCPNLITHMNY